jgi:hypothetical protein
MLMIADPIMADGQRLLVATELWSREFGGASLGLVKKCDGSAKWGIFC